jgi:aryl-alcohol dehydrogenase-like predicted oxidoreductase
MAHLILGTATFGTGYGIANIGKYTEVKSVQEIVNSSQQTGINDFDTAPSYGPAEEYLGSFLDHTKQPKISTKISRESATSAKLMLSSVRSSLLRTKVKKFDNLYLHDPEALNGPGASETIAGLKEVIELGLANRVGVSAYSLEDLLRAKEAFDGLTVFQVPENICDRRMIGSNEMMELKNQDNHFIVRSIFLQGLLLMPSTEIPIRLSESAKLIEQISSLSRELDTMPIDLCLAYGRTIPWVSGIVVGVADVSQFRQIVESSVSLPPGWESRIDKLPFSILDPRLW